MPKKKKRTLRMIAQLKKGKDLKRLKKRLGLLREEQQPKNSNTITSSSSSARRTSTDEPCSLCRNSSYVESDTGLLGTDRINGQDTVTFLLETLLRIPHPQCEELFRVYGDPEGWMNLCPPCKSLLNQALDINEQINQLRKKIKELGDQLSLPLKIKPEEENDDEDEEELEKSTHSAITEIRQIVLNQYLEEESHEFDNENDLGNNSPGLDKEEEEEEGLILRPKEEEEEEEENELVDPLGSLPVEDEHEPSEFSRKEEITIPNQIGKSKPANIIEYYKYHCEEAGCNSAFKTYDEFAGHKNEKHTEGYRCDRCGKIMSTLRSLEHHIRKLHYEKSRFPCPGCGNLYPDPMEFQNHLKNEFKDCKPECIEKSIQCTSCHWKLGDQEGYDLHMKVRHLTEYPDPFSCPSCEQRFKVKNEAYRIHVRSHTTDTDVKCPKCGKSFKSVNSLKKHEGTHTRTFKCDKCPQTFGSSGHLSRHKKLHNDVFPELCSVCGKQYKTKDSLKLHMWSHDPNRSEKYTPWKPKPKGYKPMREKRSRYRPKPPPGEEEGSTADNSNPDLNQAMETNE